MKDKILGKITKVEDYHISKIKYQSNTIEILIDPDGMMLEQSIKIAQELVLSLKQFDNLAKEILAKDLLETYNDNWSSYEETQEDGSIKNITNPLLSNDEFILKLTLKSINVIGNKLINLTYDDKGLFWGHEPAVSSSQGLDFSNAEGDIM
jgi:hypothetical protein